MVTQQKTDLGRPGSTFAIIDLGRRQAGAFEATDLGTQHRCQNLLLTGSGSRHSKQHYRYLNSNPGAEWVGLQRTVGRSGQRRVEGCARGHGCGDLAQGIPCGRSRVACKGNLWLRKQIRRAEERAALSAPPSLIVTCRSARSACRPEGQLIRRSRPARALHRVSNHCVHGIGDAGVGAHDRRRNVFSSNKRLTPSVQLAAVPSGTREPCNYGRMGHTCSKWTWSLSGWLSTSS